MKKTPLSKGILILAIIALVGLSLTAIAKPSFIYKNLWNSPYGVVFVSANYDSVLDKTCFTYKVCVKKKPALSHMLIEIKTCNGVIVLCSNPEHAEVGPDGQTGIFGIKWEDSVEPGEHMYFSFCLAGEWDVGWVTVLAKGGKIIATAPIRGPVCPSL